MAKEPRSLVKNAADPEQVARAAQVEDLRKRTREADLAFLETLPAYRRVRWEDLERARVFATVLGTDPHMTYFNEGARSLGLQMLVEISPECYALMQREAQERRKLEVGE